MQTSVGFRSFRWLPRASDLTKAVSVVPDEAIPKSLSRPSRRPLKRPTVRICHRIDSGRKEVQLVFLPSVAR